MSIVLVDVPVVEATLLSGSEPRMVQVVVSGLTAGQSVVVTAVTSAGEVFSVPGGVVTSDGSQLVLVDNRTPLNTVVRYRATVDGVPYLSDEVTVTFAAGSFLIQSLDGRSSVQFVLQANGLPRDPTFAGAVFDVPGRDRRPVRFVPGGDGGGSLLVRTNRAGSAVLLDLFKAGRPVVLRTDGTLRDLPAVDLMLLTSAPSRLWDEVSADGMSTDRVWSLSYLLVDDPEPSQVLAGSTWADFDGAMSAYTWTGFDGLFEFSTWDDFDQYDWRQLL